MRKLFFLFVFILAVATSSFADWTNDVSVNSPTCVQAGDQATPKIAATSDGGYYIAWFDNRVPNYKMYLQRYNSVGKKMFDEDGLLVSGNPQNTSLMDFGITVDNNDNCVLVFTDIRNGSAANPFAYLISPDGLFLWGPNGVNLTDSANVSQSIPVVTATSDGHYVFAWVYNSGSKNAIAMQRLDASGVKQWGSSPVKLRGTPSPNEHFNYPKLVASDNGSVIMCWDAYTGNLATTGNIKIFVQKFASDTTRQWTYPQDTIQNIGRVAGISFQPSLTSDGNNGVVCCWVDDRDINSRQSVWVQRINSNGVIQFPKNGAEGSNVATNHHFTPSAVYVPATNETFMFWNETNGDQSLFGLYGQKFNSTGTRQWSDPGKAFKPLDNNQVSFIAAFAKDTNVVVSYTQAFFGSANANVKIMRTGPSSMQHWAGDTLTVSSYMSSKIRKQAAMSPLTGQTVMTWSDNRSGSGDIYSQNIKLNGEAGVTRLDLTISIQAMWDGTTEVGDFLKVYLRSSTAPYGLVDSTFIFLDASGDANAYFMNAVSGNYYLQLIHRNALETWSANPMSISNAATTPYDFTSALSQAYGNNQILKDGRSCLYSGEINKDGSINLSDIVLISNDATSFTTGYASTDLDGNLVVNLTDLIYAFNNSTGFVVVKKP